MNNQYIAATTNELTDVARSLLKDFKSKKTFTFSGDMGAGKTTFIKAICKTLGVKHPISSPTYSIVNEYDSPLGVVYHFDFYRLKSETEALDFGVEEYFDSGNFCFIEWPEKIPNLLPVEAVKITISVQHDDVRLITAGADQGFQNTF